jgi:hypothetical protein
MTAKRITGGCQCGAVRYAITGPLTNPHICHCRMCQKAFGNYFAALVCTDRRHFSWTRGKPAIFESSANVERGFCANCGTPLSFAYKDGNLMDVSIGSLDDPASVTPENQYGAESRLPAFENLHLLPSSRSEDTIPPEALARLKSRQHPDRE